ncbi:MAG: tripartite tricarboxylate transporter substrate binding protein [Rhodospirillales bacterium]|nr:MAG: tripartite tricarboxylate transporter substrate binding protein [Rhodospirillales bacterium]
MPIDRRLLLASGLATLAAPLVRPAFAQVKWPERPVSFVVGYAAGGGADIVARELAYLLSPLLGQQVVVENKGGAAGGIGTTYVANAKPDGHTVLYAVGTNVVLNPHVLKGYRTDTLADLVPVIQTTDYQYVLAVNPDVPAKDVAELVALAKKQPAKLTYSSSGAGGNNHLAGALFATATGVDITHVPYKGTGPALMDVISGVITMNFSSLPPAVGQIKAGKLRALAVTGTTRVSALPDVPTLEEAGIKGATLKGWHGLFVPKGTPEPVIAKLEADTAAALKDPKMKVALDKDGLDFAPPRTREEFARAVREEHAFWGKKLKELKIVFE